MSGPPSPPSPGAGISVIIPTCNGGEAFHRCLHGIRNQEGVGEVELIVLDSESGDGTGRLAAEAGARVIPVARSDFNHGAVRDLGARSAGGEVLVFTVQDARPADAGWLRHLVEPLLKGASGATSRILPGPEADPIWTRTVLDSPMASGEPSVADPARASLEAMTPRELRRYARFDNVSSGIRADVYREIPFRRRAMSEDLQWAVDALRKGHRLVFAERSVVYHAHAYTPAGVYRRYREDARAVREILGLQARSGLLHALKGYLHEVARDLAFMMKLGPWTLLKYWPRALILRGYQVAGQWRGSR